MRLNDEIEARVSLGFFGSLVIEHIPLVSSNGIVEQSNPCMYPCNEFQTVMPYTKEGGVNEEEHFKIDVGKQVFAQGHQK